MVRRNSIANQCILTVRSQEFRAKRRVRALLLARDRLADVVQESYPAPLCRVQPKLRRHRASEQRHLH